MFRSGRSGGRPFYLEGHNLYGFRAAFSHTQVLKVFGVQHWGLVRVLFFATLFKVQEVDCKWLAVKAQGPCSVEGRLNCCLVLYEAENSCFNMVFKVGVLGLQRSVVSLRTHFSVVCTSIQVGVTSWGPGLSCKRFPRHALNSLHLKSLNFLSTFIIHNPQATHIYMYKIPAAAYCFCTPRADFAVVEAPKRSRKPLQCSEPLPWPQLWRVPGSQCLQLSCSGRSFGCRKPPPATSSTFLQWPKLGELQKASACRPLQGPKKASACSGLSLWRGRSFEVFPGRASGASRPSLRTKLLEDELGLDQVGTKKSMLDVLVWDTSGLSCNSSNEVFIHRAIE